MRNFFLAIVLLAVAALAFYFSRQGSTPQQPPATAPAVSKSGNNAPATPAPPPVNYPVPGPAPAASDTDKAPVEPTLPGLAQSDQPVRKALSGLYDPARLDKLLDFKSIIRHFVVTIDNMTAAKLPQRYSFTRPPAGKFLIKTGADGVMTIDKANYDRYRPYIQLMESVDTHVLTALYFRYYPLFQQAYEALGYPDRYFNDRLVAVIDHLLATPDIQGPVKLKQPVVFYTFADPELEALSAGQKLLIRMGPDNAAKVKSWLRKLRAELTHTHNKATSH